MKLTLCFFLAAFPLLAQTPPPADCQVAANVTVANGVGVVPVSPPAAAAYYDNRGLDCSLWMVSYEADSGLSGYTVAFQSSPGSITPTGFVSFAGNTVTSSASFGTASHGLALYSNLSTSATTIDTPFVRVNLTGASGTGNIHVSLQGWRSNWTIPGSGGSGGGGSGCVGTAATPCVVDGPDAPGAAPTKSPVQVSGFDGTDVQRIKTDTSGDSLVSQIGLSTFNSGQQAVTTSAANLGTNSAKSVCIHALVANMISVFAGPSGVTTSTGMEIPPGFGYCWNLANTNLLYVIASTTGASVSWTLTN